MIRCISNQRLDVLAAAAMLAAVSLAHGAPGPGRSDDTGRWGDVELIEDLRIGVLEGPDEYMFGGIRALAVGHDGSIYVADRQLELVRQYDSDGTFVRNIGRYGQGPGEYSSRFLGMKVLPDGTLALLDAPHKIIMYRADGEYLGDIRVPSALYAPRMFEFDLSGNLYVKATAGEPSFGDTDWPLVLIKVSPRGEIFGRVPLPREKRSGRSFVLHTSDGPVWYPTTSTRHAWSPLGYLVVGRNDEYSFELVRSEGPPLRVQRHVDPVAMTRGERAMWQAWKEYFKEQARQPGRSAAYAAVPRFKPAYKDLYVGDDGRIWVHRHVPAEKRDLPPREPGDKRPLFSWREPSTFDAFEPDGTFLGTVVVPRNTIVHVWRGRRLWGVLTGDQGDQVVRWRVETISE